MRRKLAAGNWKMNGTQPDLTELEAMKPAVTGAVDVLICPPATLVAAAAKASGDIAIGGQDCHAKTNGAHTGDISAQMLRDAGASYVLTGHSERRTDHAESDADIAANKPNEPRLLAVDNEMVVPVGTTVRMLITAADVIHAFAVPSFGVKTDAVPGRINETWFHARKEGMYYGQCSELCGKDHAFMPIAVRVVSKEEYAAWAEKLKAEDDVEAANLTLASLK